MLQLWSSTPCTKPLTSPSDNDTIINVFANTRFRIWDLLIIIKNNIGPSFVPWGTPAFIGSQWEIAPANLTRCQWLDRKLIIHGIKDVRTPKSRSFPISTLYPIRLKALEKSRKQRRRCQPGESRYVSREWITSSKQYVVEVPFRHPNWLGSILSLTSSINHVTTKSSRTFGQTGSQWNRSEVALIHRCLYFWDGYYNY